MASSIDPRVQLEKLAEKQMKSVLHVKFLEDCLSDELVPKGLAIKLNVSVGNDQEDKAIQASVNKLLEKTSLHIMSIVKEGHMRKVRTIGDSIENVRGTLRKNMSDKQVFDLDSDVFQKTEEKKNKMVENHKKKLSYLKQRRAGENSTESHKKDQNKTTETVSTEKHSSSSNVGVSSNADKTKPNGKNKKRKRKHKPKPKNQNGSTPDCPKTGSVTDDDVIIVGESTRQTKHQSPKEQEPKQSACSGNQPAKNGPALGTKKTYAEAITHGAKSTVRREVNQETLLETLLTVLTTVQQLMMSIQPNVERGDSSGARTEMHGKGPKRGQNKLRGAKRRS